MVFLFLRGHKQLEPAYRGLIEDFKSISRTMRMASLWPCGLGSQSQFKTFMVKPYYIMVVPFITFIGKFYYIYG